jgi:hypothetical protein
MFKDKEFIVIKLWPNYGYVYNNNALKENLIFLLSLIFMATEETPWLIRPLFIGVISSKWVFYSIE